VEVSPFPYQGPLEPSQVVERRELVADLVERVTERRVTALLGPRRYGKTSVLHRVASELSEVTTVWVDLYEVASSADVAVRFDNALAAPTGKWHTTARNLAVTLSLNLGMVKVELAGPARQRPDPAIVLSSTLDVLVRTAQQQPTLLIIDEFSSIARVPGAAGLLRTAIQHHYRDLGLVFAGSHPSMMRTLFTDRAEPFYGQADLLEIGPLSAAALEETIRAGFEQTGRDAEGLAAFIYHFSGGHPQRSMQLADASWRHWDAETSDSYWWAAGIDDVRRETSEGMERLYSGFERGERDVLRSVARSGSIYGAEADLLELAKGTASHARQTLLDSGDLLDIDGELRVVDPLLADWLRNRFSI